MQRDLLGALAGFVIALVTSPVGVSGAVFLLPVQLSFFGVPNPQVTPTNLLYNVVSGPGALIRYARQGHIQGPLARSMVLGSAPGVVVGAVLRVHVFDDPAAFKLVAAAVLFPVGLVVLTSTRWQPPPLARTPWGPGPITIASFLVAIVGGIYGIGGGSVLGPLLVSSGLAVSQVAPAALFSTFVTSVIGVASFAVLQQDLSGAIGPDWSLGLACGVGGLCGGYVGASLQPTLPEPLLRGILGFLAVALAVLYAIQGTA